MDARPFKPPFLLSRQRPDLGSGAPLIGAKVQSRSGYPAGAAKPPPTPGSRD